jgi:hypothetical protein
MIRADEIYREGNALPSWIARCKELSGARNLIVFIPVIACLLFAGMYTTKQASNASQHAQQLLIQSSQAPSSSVNSTTPIFQKDPPAVLTPTADSSQPVTPTNSVAPSAMSPSTTTSSPQPTATPQLQQIHDTGGDIITPVAPPILKPACQVLIQAVTKVSALIDGTPNIMKCL